MATKPAPATEARGDARLAIVAGSGSLPVQLARSLIARGEPAPFVLTVTGEADPRDFAGCETGSISVEQIGDLVPRLRRAGVGRCVLAGGVSRRPALSRLRPGLGLLRILPRAIRALSRGDDALLRAIIDDIERSGIDVVGAHAITPDLLAGSGLLAGPAPSAAARRDMEAARAGALAIGALDIGQAAIAIGGRVVALEGIEGTDGLLERMVALRGHGRLANRTGGVLVKCAKPNQELRADLPAIGTETVEAAVRAGLSGIGVEAGRCFVLDSEATLARARDRGVFIWGLASEEGR
jgi:UDP-2,3-diacylglucosamine hydrolase